MWVRESIRYRQQRRLGFEFLTSLCQNLTLIVLPRTSEKLVCYIDSLLVSVTLNKPVGIQHYLFGKGLLINLLRAEKHTWGAFQDGEPCH